MTRRYTKRETGATLYFVCPKHDLASSDDGETCRLCGRYGELYASRSEAYRVIHAREMKRRRIFGLAVGAGLGALIFVLMVIVDKAQESDTPTLASALVGTPVHLQSDGWTLTVTRVHTTPTVRSHQALGVYIVVDLMMDNVAKGPQALCGDRFKLRDSQNRTYPHFSAGTIDYGSRELCNRINPGLSAPASVVFDVPRDASGLVLESLGNVRARIGDVVNLP